MDEEIIERFFRKGEKVDKSVNGLWKLNKKLEETGINMEIDEIFERIRDIQTKRELKEILGIE